jgi:hypothetical protein
LQSLAMKAVTLEGSGKKIQSLPGIPLAAMTTTTKELPPMGFTPVGRQAAGHLPWPVW